MGRIGLRDVHDQTAVVVLLQGSSVMPEDTSTAVARLQEAQQHACIRRAGCGGDHVAHGLVDMTLLFRWNIGSG